MVLVQSYHLPAFDLDGEAGTGDGPADDDLVGALSGSARMLSSRASTPATACDKKEPHRDPICFCLSDTDMAGRTVGGYESDDEKAKMPSPPTASRMVGQL